MLIVKHSLVGELAEMAFCFGLRPLSNYGFSSGIAVETPTNFGATREVLTL